MSQAATDSEIQHLVQTLDDNPDRLHSDLTPSVRRLMRLGLPAAQAVLPLLDDAKPLTRMRAFRVLGNIVMRHHGWQPGSGYPDPSQEQTVQAVLRSNGNYRVDAPPAERQQAITRWRLWIEEELNSAR